MREVLAHAAAQAQRFERGRARVGGLGGIREVLVDVRHQRRCRLHQRAAGREAGARVVREVFVQRHVGRGEAELRRFHVRRAALVGQVLTYRLPGQARRGRGARQGVDHAVGAHAQRAVRERQAEIGARVAVRVHVLRALVRGGVDVQRMCQEPLRAMAEWAQVCHVQRVLHGRVVFVGGFVDDAQQHRSGTEALG